MVMIKVPQSGITLIVLSDNDEPEVDEDTEVKNKRLIGFLREEDEANDDQQVEDLHSPTPPRSDSR